MKANELHIIARILAGKTEDFGYFLETYGQQVFNLMVRMANSPEDAEELTQDTFMKAFSHLHSFKGDSSFSTWIYRIAYNTALSALRKKSDEIRMLDDKQWSTIQDEQLDEALDDTTAERIDRLKRAIVLLAPEERALVTLFYEEEKSVGEIAVILHQTESNVKVKLHRIRKKLYILIKKEEEEQA